MSKLVNNVNKHLIQFVINTKFMSGVNHKLYEMLIIVVLITNGMRCLLTLLTNLDIFRQNSA